MSLSQNIIAKAEKARENLIPARSKTVYCQEYDNFTKWKNENHADVCENVMLA